MGKRRSNEKNNFQDKSEVREYDKGFAAGAGTRSDPKPQPKNNKRGGKPNRAGNRSSAKKYYGKGKQGSAGVAAIVTNEKPNDASWYIPTNMLAEGVAQVPESVKSGLPIKVHENLIPPMNNTTMADTPYTSMPGVLVYNTYHTIGSATDQTSAINIAANQFYQTMQAHTSRVLEYGPPQVMMQIVATADILAMYHWMVRLYGYLNERSVYDAYKPEVIVQAMGVNFNDFSARRQEYRNGINMLASAINSLYIPKAVDYTLRRVMLYRAVYTDSNDAKAQMFMFNPLGFWKYIEGSISEPTNHLEYIPFNPKDQQLTVDYVLKFARSLFEFISISDDVRECTSDLTRTFGTGNTIVVNEIAETFSCSYEYSTEILSQLENAYILPRCANYSEIKQVTGGVDHNLVGFEGKITHRTGINESHLLKSEYIWYPATRRTIMEAVLGDDPEKLNKCLPYTNYLINFHSSGQVSPEDLIEATRLAEVPEFAEGELHSIDGEIQGYRLITDQTEILLGAKIYTYSRSVNGQMVVYSTDVHTDMWGVLNLKNKQLTYPEIVDAVALLSRFDWAPRVRTGISIVSENGSDIVSCITNPEIFDYDNYFRVPRQMLSQMNEVCLRGQFSPRLPGIKFDN